MNKNKINWKWIWKNINYKKILNRTIYILLSLISIFSIINLPFFVKLIWYLKIITLIVLFLFIFILFIIFFVICLILNKKIKLNLKKPFSINLIKDDFCNKWNNFKNNDLFIISVNDEYTMNFNIKNEISESTIHGKFIKWCQNKKIIEDIENQIENNKIKEYFCIVETKIEDKIIKFLLLPLTKILKENNYEATITGKKDSSENLLSFENKLKEMIINFQGIINETINIYLPLIGAGNARISLSKDKDKTLLLIKIIECFRDYHKTPEKKHKYNYMR